MIWTGTHDVGDPKQRCGRGYSQPISVGDGCWIGVRCTIHKDIGSGCVVDTSSTVITPIADNSHVFGNPARVLKKLPVAEDSETLGADNYDVPLKVGQ